MAILNVILIYAGCKTTARIEESLAETSALHADQHLSNTDHVLFGFSSPATKIIISHWLDKLMIIQQLILILGIWCEQIIMACIFYHCIIFNISYFNLKVNLYLWLFQKCANQRFGLFSIQEFYLIDYSYSIRCSLTATTTIMPFTSPSMFYAAIVDLSFIVLSYLYIPAHIVMTKILLQ